jgi:hypothetical protein
MDHLYVIAALVTLTGCASSQPTPEFLAASTVPNDAATVAALVSGATVVDLSDPENQIRTICRNRRVTGSHLIKGLECDSLDAPEPTGLDKLALKRSEWEIEQFQRRNQDEMLRRQADDLRRGYVRR